MSITFVHFSCETGGFTVHTVRPLCTPLTLIIAYACHFIKSLRMSSSSNHRSIMRLCVCVCVSTAEFQLENEYMSVCVCVWCAHRDNTIIFISRIWVLTKNPIRWMAFFLFVCFKLSLFWSFFLSSVSFIFLRTFVCLIFLAISIYILHIHTDM